MTTEAQLQANKQNALRSTSPKSVQGRAKASQNSAKHGLLSKDLLIHDEKLKELDSFRNGIYQSLCPQGEMEILLVENIINAAWHLRRLTKAENEVIVNSDDYFGNRGSVSAHLEDLMARAFKFFLVTNQHLNEASIKPSMNSNVFKPCA